MQSIRLCSSIVVSTSRKSTHLLIVVMAIRSLVLLAVSTSAVGSVLRATRACPNTELSTSNSANAAGTAVFSTPSAQDGQCVSVGSAINSIKFCGPGDLLISRMTCDKHHEYKSETISHPSSSWTKGKCEDVSLAGTVADGHLGSYTLDC